MRDEVGGKRRLVDAQNDPICVRADVKTARTPPRQNDGSGTGGSRHRSAKLVRGQRKPGCSPPPTEAARFCSRREESIGSWSFTGAPWRVDIEHG